jgi:hypothetical protein
MSQTEETPERQAYLRGVAYGRELEQDRARIGQAQTLQALGYLALFIGAPLAYFQIAPFAGVAVAAIALIVLYKVSNSING